MRVVSIAAAALALVACKQPAKRDEAAAKARLVVHQLGAHQGATALYGGRTFLVSTARDWDKPGTIQMSRGDGTIERTFQGWLIGAGGERAWMALVAPDGVKIVRAGLTGEPEELETLPLPEKYSYPGGVVGDGGNVAVVIHNAATHVYGVGPPHTIDVRAAPEGIFGIAANPAGRELLLAMRQVSGPFRDDLPDARLVLVDLTTGAVRWQVALTMLTASEGYAAFVPGGVLIHHSDGFHLHDLASGAATARWPDTRVDGRNELASPDGTKLVFTHQLGTGHGSWVDPTCNIELLDDVTHLTPMQTDVLVGHPGQCYFGMGMVFVDGELWVAGP